MRVETWIRICAKKLSICTFFEESVPGPSSTINSDTLVQSIDTTQSNTEAPRGVFAIAPLK